MAVAIIEIREFFLFRFDYDVSGLFVDLDGRYFMYLGGVGLMELGRRRRIRGFDDAPGRIFVLRRRLRRKRICADLIF